MRDRLLINIGTGAAAVMAGVHLYASFFPGAANWSVHHLAFFPLARYAIVALMVIAIVQPFQRALLGVLERLLQRFNSCRSLVRWLAVLLVLAGIVLILWSAREKLFFLGDGYLVLRNLGQIHSAATIPTMSFRDAPLTAVLLREMSKIFEALSQLSADELAFRWLSIASGIGWILTAYWLSRLLSERELDRALVMLFLLAWSGVQLFFGYVEVYPLASCMLLLFLVSSVAHFRKHLTFVVPSFVFGILLATHFSMIFLLPAYAWMLYANLRGGKFGKVLLGCIAAAGVFIILLTVGEYTGGKFIQVALSGGAHGVPIGTPDPQKHAYTLFSPNHIAEVANLLILATPLAPVMLLVIVLLYWKVLRWRDGELVMLTIAVISCGSFIFFMNPDLGMSRDWDVFSLFTIPILVFVLVESFKYVVSESSRRRVLWMAASLGILHAIPWIAVNTTESEALERFGMLNDSRLWGRTAVLNSYDELASYYRSHDNLRKGREYYEKYFAIDSSNGRVLGNFGSICQDLGDDSSAILYYERAIRHATIVTTVYADLGKLYSQRNRFDEAIEVSKRGLARGFFSADAFNSIGIFLIKKTDTYGEALGYFERAIQLDSTFDNAYLNAGVSCSYLKRYPEMKRYLTKFLELRPDYAEAGKLRRAIENAK